MAASKAGRTGGPMPADDDRRSHVIGIGRTTRKLDPIGTVGTAGLGSAL
jgi:hypothetical protein